jgi:inner membrane transporter RhtA
MLVAKRVGSLFHGSGGLAPALAVSALVLAPAGVVGGGWRMLHPSTIVLAIGVGLLSAALPFALELAALRRMRAATYGILVSLEPALAALAGLVFLGQRLGAPQATGVALVVAASIGSSKTAALVPVER